MMRFMQWLHRWVSLIIVTQVLLWLVSGLYFALAGNASMSGRQYVAPASPLPMLTTLDEPVSVASIRDRYPGASTIRLMSVDGKGQYEVRQSGTTHYIDAATGARWQTDEAMAVRLAQLSYAGPGNLGTVEAVTGSDEVHGWDGAGYRIAMRDDLNTRIYVDSASGQVLEHRNTPWTLGDWAFRLHFMDYSGSHNFNHLLIWTAGLLALWFSLSGLILLMRNIARGDMNPLRRQTWLEHFQQRGEPLPSACGGGGSCGLCKVTMTGDCVPAPSEAGQALLSDAELDVGVRLSCQHRVSDSYTAYPVNDNVSEQLLTLVTSRSVSPSIVELTFKSEQATPYQAGQFMQFSIPYEPAPLLRHYSMAARPQQPQLVFNVRRMPSPKAGIPPGAGSGYLCNLREGEQVVATGPFGDFQLTDNSDNSQLFIGGGAGIAPLRALIQSELAKSDPRESVFFYGARNEQELVYRDELEHAEGLVYTPVLSESSDDERWQGETGYVHEAAMRWLATQRIDAVDIYVCGPPAMLKATLTALDEAGVPGSHIRFDDFGI